MISNESVSDLIATALDSGASNAECVLGGLRQNFCHMPWSRAVGVFPKPEFLNPSFENPAARRGSTASLRVSLQTQLLAGFCSYDSRAQGFGCLGFGDFGL